MEMRYKQVKNLINSLLFVGAFFCIGLLNANAKQVSNRNEQSINKESSEGRSKEKRADKFYVKGNFQEAFRIYEELVLELNGYAEQKSNTVRKLARLYVYNQENDNAQKHYEYLFKNSPSFLNIDDICNYVDILREKENYLEAEVVCRNYAYNDKFSSSQRFKNLLHSLTEGRYYNNVGEQEYVVKSVNVNSNRSEYFIDFFEYKPFYIASESYINDPNKIFFHRNQTFYLADSLRDTQVFDFIPLDLQDGPIAVNKTNDLIVVTVNKYNGMNKITLKEGASDMICTKLYASYFDKKKGRWTKFQPLFPDKNTYSYAHPSFSSDGRSVFFSSNCPGGYGGMDLYVSRHNADNSWSSPKNLGKLINTEANEIFPVEQNNELSFSSNGLIGNGGYDVFKINLRNNKIEDGTLYHFPSPINGVFNDYCLKLIDGSGFMISDRNRENSDDIFKVLKIETSISSSLQQNSRMQQIYALSGVTSIINGYEKYQKRTRQPVDAESALYARSREGDLLLTLYYDFDTKVLTASHIQQIIDVFSDLNLQQIQEVLVVGFSDVMGSKQYNSELSFLRAEEVTKYLEANYTLRKITSEGRGRLFLDDLSQAEHQHEYFIFSDELRQDKNKFMEEVARNQKSRKVDIIIKEVKN